MKAAARERIAKIDVAASWKAAQKVWEMQVDLRPPEPFAKRRKGGSHWPEGEPLAFIDLSTRQVVINFELLDTLRCLGSLTGILAHELGHHVAFPHTMRLAAELEVLQHKLVPGLQSSLTNLFFDLQVNEVVGRTRAAELIAVYRAFVRRPGASLGPLFGFYLAVYEALWALPVGHLVPEETAKRLEAQFPGFRGDAQMFVQTFYSLPGHHLPFAYFCSRFARYIQDPETGEAEQPSGFPMTGDVGEPSPDDYAGALGGSPWIDRAAEEASERGWLEDVDEAGGVAGGDDDPLATLGRMRGGRPGSQEGPFRRIVANRLYKRLVERHLLDIPATEEPPDPDPFLPTTTVEWEPGDDPRAIDWTQSVLASGPLAGVRPLRRELEPDVPLDGTGGLPSMEIYLDTSGSMPDPTQRMNAMSLAAQVLSASTIRKGGKVRGIIYSSGEPMVSDWMYGEETARDFFLHYVGGGTDYPVKVLVKSAEQYPGVIRIVLSDSDYLWNYGHASKKLTKQWHEAIEASHLYVAMLNAAEGRSKESLKPMLELERFRLVIVREMGRFGRAAADLSRALFGD